MNAKLKLKNGKLVRDDEQPKEVPQVEEPKEEIVEEVIPEELTAEEGIPQVEEDVPEVDGDFPEDVYADAPEQPEQMPPEGTNPQQGILILNIAETAEPLSIVVPIDKMDETIESIRMSIADNSTITVENRIINCRYIVDITLVAQ